jgi:phosphoglucomutase
LRLDGSVWSTDKDGLIPSLLAAEMTARTGRDPSQLYQKMTEDLGLPFSTRVDAKATPQQKALLGKLSPDQVKSTRLAGEDITRILSHAPGNNQAIGGLKVMTENGWFAARPSGTEDIYKIYAESFIGDEHLNRLVEEAQVLVDTAIA